MTAAGVFLVMMCGTVSTDGRPGAGDPAPPFTVFAGKEKRLHSRDLFGRVIVITYETRETFEFNQEFKNAVLTFCSQNPAAAPVAVVPVANCAKYVWPIRRYCIARIQEYARKKAMNLYDDRTGEMFENYGMQDDASNILIVDKSGIIRYRRAGRLDGPEIDAAIELLHVLTAATRE